MEHDACGVGFVAHLRGEPSRDIVEQALDVLKRLGHRGACGADAETGDGAGVLIQLPHDFLRRVCAPLGIELSPPLEYAVGQAFLPAEPAHRAECERLIEAAVADQRQDFLGWRDVPVDRTQLGPVAASVLPVFRQFFVGRRRLAPTAFERRLFVVRKLAENMVRGRQDAIDPQHVFHIASLSSETIVYKGLLLPDRLDRFFPDLADTEMSSGLALVHSRFSTNTFPTWDLAQPLRMLAHNGEINTVGGNANWMEARRSLLASTRFRDDLDRLFPIIVRDKSDSAQLDNMLELFVHAGRDLPHALMMMIPEAWEADREMDDERRAFYEYASALQEPWDGPAAVTFTDGRLIGAALDRNGLRPLRYLVTDDDRIILASETGVVDVPAGRIRRKGRLGPGRMLMVDTVAGSILEDAELKQAVARRAPFRRWLDKNQFFARDLEDATAPAGPTGDDLRTALRVYGYTDEDLSVLLLPMGAKGKEPLGSMGTDTPLAVLSDRAPLLYDYFHQLFAQVTNPAIDPLRESMVMSLRTAVGPHENPFEDHAEQCHRLILDDGPILTPTQLERIRTSRRGIFDAISIPTLAAVADGPAGLERALGRIADAADEAVSKGHNLLILSDRGADAEHAPVPSLLALGAVHHRLVRAGTRLRVGLIVESGEAREVHHVACLLGYGAAAICPWLAFAALDETASDGPVPELDAPRDVVERRYVDAIHAGLLKIMSKMGISTVQSYRGAQIFEIVGLSSAVVSRCFDGTASRVGGVDIQTLGAEMLARHARAFGPAAAHDLDLLPEGGVYRWRRRGERHKWNPRTVALLQASTRDGLPDSEARARFAAYEAAVDDESDGPLTLRGLLEFVGAAPADAPPIPLEEVESATDIVKRFVTGAMSFGSISAEAHETLAIAMNRLGGRSNSGEGGEESRRYLPDANGDLRRSAIHQVASGRFGVTTEYLVECEDLQIKVAQGAKPGEGGQLPGHKVDARIARVRCSTPGVTLISPPPHHDIYSIEDLKQLIYDLKAVNPEARVSVKLVSEVGVGTVAAGVAKAGADVVVIAGWSGGTGASPLSSIKHAGLPWEIGLAETQQVLCQNGLRGRIRVQVDGGFRTGRDVVVAAMLGAEEFGFATAALITEGCIMLRRCHQNTCSVGVATQDPELRKRFSGEPDHVVNFMLHVAESVRGYMARLGFRTLDEMVGAVERLKARDDLTHWKARQLDLGPLLSPPRESEFDASRRCTRGQDAILGEHPDRLILAACEQTISGGPPTSIQMRVGNTMRAVGAMVSGEIARLHGSAGLPDDSQGAVRGAGRGEAAPGQPFPAGEQRHHRQHGSLRGDRR
jgi:glutamate synthase (NADPH/NADH) large chain